MATITLTPQDNTLAGLAELAALLRTLGLDGTHTIDGVDALHLDGPPPLHQPTGSTLNALEGWLADNAGHSADLPVPAAGEVQVCLTGQAGAILCLDHAAGDEVNNIHFIVHPGCNHDQADAAPQVQQAEPAPEAQHPTHMNHWPHRLRPDLGVVERVCLHGLGHPGPDEAPREHTCDGCCRH